MVGATPDAPVLESPSARQPEERSTAFVGGLGSGEPLAQTTDASVMTPEVTVGTVGPSRAEATVAGDAPEPKEANLMMAEEQLVPPNALLGVVGPAVCPQSPATVPQTMVEEDEVEEIERAEPQLHFV